MAFSMALLLLTQVLPSQNTAIAQCDANTAGRARAIALGPPQADKGHAYYGMAIITASQPFCMGWTVITVFRDENRNWALRKIVSSSDPNEPPVEQWAFDSTCPAILDALEGLENLPMKFGIGPIRRVERSREPIRIPMLHGINYTVQGYGLVTQPSGATASLLLSSNEGEVAVWARSMMQSLAPCWAKSG